MTVPSARVIRAALPDVPEKLNVNGSAAAGVARTNEPTRARINRIDAPLMKAESPDAAQQRDTALGLKAPPTPDDSERE